jgi:imidazolonepropionase-like amidohydrolase
MGRGHKALAEDPDLSPYLTARAKEALAASSKEFWSRVYPGYDVSMLRFEVAEASIRVLEDARVPILAGTDSPVGGMVFGASLHGELELLVRAGLSPKQALAGATALTAKHFGLSDRGRIAPGARADLVLVRGNPLTDIKATRRITAIWKAGRRVKRDPPPPPASATSRPT